MKKLVITLVVACFLPVVANAKAASTSGQPDTDSCGLGWQVTQKKSLLATWTRGTTNGFVPPTFGMTSGTLGCEQHSISRNEVPAATYAFNNFEPLTMEMAQGSGEYLNAFARTLGCSDSVKAEFGATIQNHYNEIVGSEKTSAVEMFNNVKTQIRNNPVLANGCNA